MTDLRGNLNVFIDDDGILPVKDRLENRSLSYSCRHPILLNRDSYLTELIFFFFFFEISFICFAFWCQRYFE